MKKAFILTLTSLTISLISLAQLSIRGHLGINTQKIDFETIQGQIKGSTGLSIGIDAQFGNMFYFQPGINYSAKKFKIDGIGEITANKLNVPVMFGLRMFKPKSSFSNNIRFFGGPNFSNIINEKISDAITDINKDDLKDFNIDAIAGIGLDVRIFFIDLGYKYGLNDYINKNGKSAPLNSFFVNLGVRF
ncbi:hypothetical protein LBMAG25_12570 [Bacteroidota bacterium]|nr:hypothetical protein LBMAG25_12570 [Bacteroidota bacterium]